MDHHYEFETKQNRKKSSILQSRTNCAEDTHTYFYVLFDVHINLLLETNEKKEDEKFFSKKKICHRLY